MIQYGLDIPHTVRGYFTLEKHLLNRSLSEMEDILGYNKGRLKQGADFFILSPPSRPSDFDVMGTSVFQGHRFENSNLQKTINSNDKKHKDISIFRRKRPIKVVPLQIHLDALRPFISEKEYHVIREIETTGLTTKALINEIRRRFRDNGLLLQQLEQNIAQRANVYKAVRADGVDDYLYPSAKGSGVPQWKLNVALPARCVCRMTDYTEDRYQRLN